MINLTLGQIASMNEIMGKIMEKPFPASMTFKIARLARELAKEIQTFEEARAQIAKKYGKKNENGELEVSEDGKVSIPPELIDACNADFTALINTEIELGVSKIPLSTFDNIELTPREMMLIEPIIDEE